MTFTIEEYGRLNYAPGFALAAQGWAELIVEGLIPPTASLGWSSKVVVARVEDGAPIGVIVWDRQDHLSEAFIVLGYVDRAHRRRGVYSALYARLREVAKREELHRVSGTTSFDNAPMRAAAERQGRRPVSVTYSEEL